jgi:hypothetical protein
VTEKVSTPSGILPPATRSLLSNKHSINLIHINTKHPTELYTQQNLLCKANQKKAPPPQPVPMLFFYTRNKNKTDYNMVKY